MLDLQYYSPLLPVARQHTLPCINVDPNQSAACRSLTHFGGESILGGALLARSRNPTQSLMYS